MKKITIAVVVVILLSFIIAGYAYHVIPGERVASHWNSAGEVNGYMSKFWGLFLVPLILIGICLLFWVIPLIDPLKKNIEKFRNYFNGFILVFALFLFYIFILTVIANFGFVFNMTFLLIPAVGLLFIYLGFIMNKLKRNWFIGIRTPWTISNDKVWEKTHKLGSVLFKISGILVILGVFFQNYLIWFILVPVIVSAVISVVYSYFVYRKMKK